MLKWLTILFIPCAHIVAQDQTLLLIPLKHSIQTTFSVQKPDLFISMAYTYKVKQRLELGLELGTGMRKSIFLSGFFPQLALYSSYTALDFKRFQFCPSFRLAGAITFMPSSRINYLSPEIGFQVNYGARLKVFLQSYFGRSLFWQSAAGPAFPYWSCHFGTGVKYAW
jgi:hypothetical protein